jgi:hypothetical protein
VKNIVDILKIAGFIFALSIFPLIIAMPVDAFYLPDTGQTTCYSSKGKGKVITCPAPGDPEAQDGSYTINPQILLHIL